MILQSSCNITRHLFGGLEEHTRWVQVHREHERAQELPFVSVRLVCIATMLHGVAANRNSNLNCNCSMKAIFDLCFHAAALGHLQPMVSSCISFGWVEN